MEKKKNIFISHHHKDDQSVTDFTRLLAGKDYGIRNSSIRVNQKNQERLEKKQIPRKTLERLLTMKMRWASTVIVLIGAKTHSREWVNWEIEQAAKLGKRIIGVFMKGGKDADIPENLEKYGDGLVGWNSNKIIEGLEGKEVGWCTSTGEARSVENHVIRIACQ
ncbi:TIR domain-containing protein [Sphingobacterium kitahiroshimense]|uniref:TIR domain-containing protein n=1 Tax=Sphingobacterium kitahiroshimense TaxID=470446 RepID=UPI003207E0C2